MTREELLKIVEDGYVYSDVPPDEVVDRILAALERERGEEVVIQNIEDAYKELGLAKQWPIQGQLIFRPTKAKEAGL